MQLLLNYIESNVRTWTRGTRRGRSLFILCVAGLIILVTPLQASASTTLRINVTAAGSPDSSNARVSQDGSVVAFETSSDLVTGDDNGAEDVLAYNRNTDTTQRVSLDANGDQFSVASFSNGISDDGQYVLFTADTDPTKELYLRDQVNETSELIEISFDGLPVNVTHSRAAAMTPDARYITIWGRTGDGIPGGGDDDRQYVFVHDRDTDTTERVSVLSNGGLPNDDSFFDQGQPISDDGRYVTFYTRATNMVTPDNNGAEDVFVHDRDTGSTTRINETAGNVQSPDYAASPVISGNGRYVSYATYDNNVPALYVKDRSNGALERYGVGLSETDIGTGPEVAFSTDGQYLVFRSRTPDLVANDFNEGPDIFRVDITTSDIERVSVGLNGEEAVSVDGSLSISGDGMVITFGSPADNLVANDTNLTSDIFIRDLTL